MTCVMAYCPRPVRSRALCVKHYGWLRRRGNLDPVLPRTPLPCAVPECSRRHYGRGFCRMHLDRLKVHGSATLADERIAEQQGLCAICALPPRGRGHEGRLHLDHDHQSGQHRGMLCGPCNKAVGLLQDDPKRAEALAQYLRMWSAVV